MVSLWHLLTLISAVMPLAGAVLAAKIGRHGIGGFGLAAVVGLLFAAGNIWIMKKLHTKLLEPGAVLPKLLPAIYSAALLWAFLAEFLSYCTVSVLMRSLG